MQTNNIPPEPTFDSEKTVIYTVVPSTIRAGCSVITPDGKEYFYAYLSSLLPPGRSPSTPVNFGLLPKSVQVAVNKNFADRFSMTATEQEKLSWPPIIVPVPSPTNSKDFPAPLIAQPKRFRT